jgi:hypothetical protein
LAIGPPNNVAAELIVERKAGIVLQGPTDIAEQLQKWIVQKQVSGAIPPLPLDAGTGLSREEQTRHLERVLLEIVTAKMPTN